MYFNKSPNPPPGPPSGWKSDSNSSLGTTTSLGSASSLVSNGSSKGQPKSIREALSFFNKDTKFRESLNRSSLKSNHNFDEMRGANGESYKKSSLPRFAKPVDPSFAKPVDTVFAKPSEVAQVLSPGQNVQPKENGFIVQGQTETAKPVVVMEHRHLDGYVGFANLPNQIYRKAVKRGFDFTLMVVGESGLGKSTLINSMFLTDVYSAENPGPSHRIKKTVEVETSRVLLQESGVKLNLTIVDTPGFGDAIDNSNCWKPVVEFVTSQFESYLDAESRVTRVPVPDTRVHACLYFIAPSGHGLKPLDVEFMRRLQDKVNIIPVISKADTMTHEEIDFFKDQIRRQIHLANIKIYDFPDENLAASEEKDKMDYLKLKNRVPFAVVGSNTVIEMPGDNKRVLGRRYPWGVVDIENLQHCDFIPLRSMIIRTNLLDLIDVTNNVLYENFRCRKLATMAGVTLERIPNKNPYATLEDEKREHQSKIEKMEQEMEDIFERKVSEKKKKLADSEQELKAKMTENAEKMELQRKDLEERRKAFIGEKQAWESLNGMTVDEMKKLSTDNTNTDLGIKKRTLTAMTSFRMGK